MPCPRTQQASLPAYFPHRLFCAQRQARKPGIPFFEVFWYDLTWGNES